MQPLRVAGVPTSGVPPAGVAVQHPNPLIVTS